MARYSNPVVQYLDGSGASLPGNELFFYEPGTTTFKNTYTDSGLGTPNTNPVVADSEGRIPDIWLDGVYKVKLTDSSNVVIWTRDPVGDIVEGQWATYLNDKTYNIPDIVEASNKRYYRSLADANQGNDPVSFPAKWEKLQIGRLYNANITYLIGDSAYGSDGALYFSITNTNLNNDPTEDTTATNWRSYSITAYLKTNTALSDAAATLTAAQLIGGQFTITPTVARIQTTDTAANIISALIGSVDNSNFEFTVVNLDDFDVTISAGVGVTLIDDMIVKKEVGTFRVRRLTSSTVSVTRTGSTATNKIQRVSVNVLPNTRWQIHTALNAVTMRNHQSTGGFASMTVSSYTTGSNEVVCTTADTAQYKDGDLVTFSGGSNANMEITSAKIRGLVVDTSFIIDLPLGAIGIAGTSCSAIGVTPGDLTDNQGHTSDGWTKPSTTIMWLDNHSQNAYDNSPRQVAIQKATAGEEYHYHIIPNVSSYLGKNFTLGLGGMHKIKGGAGTWRAFIQHDGTGSGLTYSAAAVGTDYEWLEVSREIPIDATFLHVGWAFNGDSGDVYMCTQPMGGLGDFIGSWNYSQKPSEYLIPVVKFNPLSYVNSSITIPTPANAAGDYGWPLRFDAETNGVMSDDVLWCSVQLESRSSTTDRALGIRNQEDVPHIYGILSHAIVASLMAYSSGICTLKNGNGYVYSGTSASPWFNVSVDINGYYLS